MKKGKLVGLGTVLFATTLLLGGCGQEKGQVGVWTSPTNKFIKTTKTPGIHNYNPFNNVEYYDVKNNTIKFTSSTAEDKNATVSPSITIQNKDGVSGEVELSVIYSIDPNKVKDIWEKYGSQEAFNSNVVIMNIRSIVRNEFTKFNSLETYNERGKIEKNIDDALVKDFKSKGVIIDDVSLQAIKYSEDIVESFNTYQKKAVEIENARADKEKAIIEADKKVEVAKKEAEANRIQSESLTEQILSEKYIDALKTTQNKVIITDGKTIPYLNTGEQ